VAELRRDLTVEIIFIDDGSTDGTGSLIAEAFKDDPAAKVIWHDRGLGLGAGVRTGFHASRGDVVVTTDCDASYPFTLIPSLLERLTPDVDIVTASCYHPDGGVENVPGYRVLLSKSASFMYRVLLDWDVHTYTCLFRAYRRDVVERVPFDSNDFLGVTEILAKSILAGYAVDELPCTLRARRYGQSKARVARIIRSHLRFQARLLTAQRSPRRARKSDVPTHLRTSDTDLRAATPGEPA
jgi:dolichol-phosphate mannosyltransferase